MLVGSCCLGCSEAQRKCEEERMAISYGKVFRKLKYSRYFAILGARYHDPDITAACLLGQIINELEGPCQRPRLDRHPAIAHVGHSHVHVFRLPAS